MKPASKRVFPIRVVVDYHVDRPGVEALQGVELTGTNRPDTSYFSTLLQAFNHEDSSVCSFLARDRLEPRLDVACEDQISGADSGGVPPVPIPNTAVKPASADGTWGESPWESRTPPE